MLFLLGGTLVILSSSTGHIDHSARVLKVITWNRSCKGLNDQDDGKDDFDNEELETHATILDKMLAWEKKLYDEVKVNIRDPLKTLPSSDCKWILEDTVAC